MSASPACSMRSCASTCRWCRRWREPRPIPVEKPMELLPLGPVLFIDTAGIDDEGALGELRVKRTTEVFDRIDLGLIVAAGEWGPFEDALVREMQARQCRWWWRSTRWMWLPASSVALAALRERGLLHGRDQRGHRRGTARLAPGAARASPGGFSRQPSHRGGSGRPGTSWPCWWSPSTKKLPRDA
jgi:hypothetical protein